MISEFRKHADDHRITRLDVFVCELESLAHFFVHETCGQCAPCRLGTRQIYHLIQTINQRADAPAERQKLEQLGQTIKRICACGLGMSAANPALTYLHHFEAV